MPPTWHEQTLERLKVAEGHAVYLGHGSVLAVRSGSDPMGFHYVLEFPWGRVCTCRGYRFRGSCKHAGREGEEGLDS